MDVGRRTKKVGGEGREERGTAEGKVQSSPDIIDDGIVHIHGRRSDTGTAPVHMVMPTAVQTPRKSDGHGMRPWML